MAVTRRRLGALVMAALTGSAGAVSAEHRPATRIVAPVKHQHAIRAALRLLPRRPAEVRVVDASAIEPASLALFLRSEAFVSRGSAALFLTAHSPVLKAASEGSPNHVHVLAAILWHEMAHLEGADERVAQRKEASLWRSFVRDARVEPVSALRYLKRMEDRHPPSASVSDASRH